MYKIHSWFLTQNEHPIDATAIVITLTEGRGINMMMMIMIMIMIMMIVSMITVGFGFQSYPLQSWLCHLPTVKQWL